MLSSSIFASDDALPKSNSPKVLFRRENFQEFRACVFCESGCPARGEKITCLRTLTHRVETVGPRCVTNPNRKLKDGQSMGSYHR